MSPPLCLTFAAAETAIALLDLVVPDKRSRRHVTTLTNYLATVPTKRVTFDEVRR